MGQPSIQVRANYIVKAPNFDAAYHLFITVDDGNGNVTYYRGGPATHGSSGRDSSGSSSGSSSGGSSGSSSGGSGGSSSGSSSGGSSGGSSGSSESGSQKLVTDYGFYVKGSVDYNENALIIYQAKINPEDISRVKNYLTNQMNLIQKAKINYFITGPNSNSTVGTALRNMGINVRIPKGIWVPGFEQQLIDQNGRRASIETEGVSTYANNSNREQLLASAATSKSNNSNLTEALSILNGLKQSGSDNPNSFSSNSDIDAGLKILSQIKEDQKINKEAVPASIVDKELTVPSKSRDNGIGGL
jgi:hypothetical protein